jgi:type III secretion protein U
VAVVHGFFRILMGATLVFAVIDVIMQRHAHNKGLMMSLEDIIKEYKQSEGDPMIKGQRKQIAMEILNSDPVQATGTANAVVVNPTHFAVALFYKPGEVTVPMVCAKGHAETAQAMIAHAQSLGIPVIRHVWLARTLFATGKAGQFVPAPTLSATALLFAVVDYMRECEASYLVLDESPLPPGATAA